MLSKIKVILKPVYLLLRNLALHLAPVKERKAGEGPLQIKSILAIRIDRIGDLVQSLPAIKALKEAFPGSRVSVMVEKANGPLLKGVSYVDEVIVYEGFLRAISRLRKRNFDLAVDLLLDYTLKTALLARLLKAKLSAGFDIHSRGKLFNIRYKPCSGNKLMYRHIYELIEGVCKALSCPGIIQECVSPEIPVSGEDRDLAISFLEANGVKKGDIVVGIQPGARYPSQRWPLARFSELADNLISRYDVVVVIIASEAERPLVEKMVSLMKHQAVKAVGFPLDKLAGIISAMDILVCNNSGPLHIACAAGTPTLSAMGPTDPALWLPEGERHVVIRHQLDCGPCSRGYCRRHDCMKLISVQEMQEAAGVQIERLNEQRGHKPERG